METSAADTKKKVLMAELQLRPTVPSDLPLPEVEDELPNNLNLHI